MKPAMITNSAKTLTAAIFGALWGLLEVVIGNALHMARVPFRGVLLSLCAIALLVCAREFLRPRGSLLLVGAVAASLKGASMGGLALAPMIAIAAEAALAEGIFALAGFHRGSALLAGGTIMVYTVMHSLAAQGVLFGLDIYRLYMDSLERLGEFIQLPPRSAWLLLAILAGGQIALGVGAAFFGWQVGQRTRILLEESGS